MNSDIMANLKYARITSVDAERIFLAHKNILKDRMHNFYSENFEKTIRYCFAKIDRLNMLVTFFQTIT